MSNPQFNQPAQSLEYNLHHVAQHNAQQAGQEEYGEGPLINSGLPSYQEPEPIGLGVNFTDHGTYPEPQQHDPYTLGDPYSYSDTAFNTPPTMHTPETPHSNAGRSTRSGRGPTRTDSPMSSDTRVSKSTNKAKPKKKRSGSPLAPEYQMTVPFTLLDYDWGDVPLKAVNERAKWSEEKRRVQSTKKNGGLGRPMNNFMLYRAAWADRCKHYFKITNHQKVSKILGHSWRLESAALKEEWSNLAKGESENHKTHLPEYKYQPSKPGTKRDQDDSDMDDYGADGDPDGEYVPPGYRHPQTRRLPPRDVQQAPTIHYGQDTYGHQVDLNGNGWSYDYAQQTQPVQYSQVQPYPVQNSQYLAAGTHHQWQHPMEEMRMMNATPASTYSATHGLVGLPGGQAQDILNNSRTQTPLQQFQQPQVGGNFVDQNAAVYPDHGFNQQAETALPSGADQNTHFEDAIGDIGGHVDSQELVGDGNWLDPSLGLTSTYDFGLGE